MIRLWLLRLKRRGLMRERARLHQYRLGIEYELAVNARDAEQTETQISELLDEQRRRRMAARFPVSR